MRKKEAQELLKKYRLGECNKREAAIVEQWYSSLGYSVAELPAKDDRQRIKVEILENINNEISGNDRMRHLKYTDRFNGDRWFGFSNLKKIAAILLVGITLAFFFYNQIKGPVLGSTESSDKEFSADLPPSIVYLSDGSIVKLKKGSKLEYPMTFTGATREVRLIGEAFFEVARDVKRPFIIHSAHLTTKVLGTSFNIRAYENSDSTEVSVVTGKVSVHVTNDSKLKGEILVLDPHQKAVYSNKSKSFVQVKENQTIITDDTIRPKLVFNETALWEIVKVINKYYEINITLENEKMRNCLITAELTDEPLELSLKIITKAIGAVYEIDGREIILKGKGCPERE